MCELSLVGVGGKVGCDIGALLRAKFCCLLVVCWVVSWLSWFVLLLHMGLQLGAAFGMGVVAGGLVDCGLLGDKLVWLVLYSRLMHVAAVLSVFSCLYFVDRVGLCVAVASGGCGLSLAFLGRPGM